MISAIVGILSLDAGQPGWLTRFSGIAAITCVLLCIVASIPVIMQSSWYPLPLTLLSILLMLGGMFALGITILRGDKITGWQAWTPISVAIFGLIVSALFSVNLFIHFILLGLWGSSWMVVGYVVISHVSDN